MMLDKYQASKDYNKLLAREENDITGTSANTLIDIQFLDKNIYYKIRSELLWVEFVFKSLDFHR
jgi:hypothetical protein